MIHRIRANTPASIRSASRAALSTRSERKRFDALTSLNGVSAPMASAALTLLNPKRYGVLDIHVWSLLRELGAVAKNPGAVGFSFGNWSEFLAVVRHLARTLGCTARDVERTLFALHRARQVGPLYRSRPQRPRP
ncbi:MAG: hypothetical protein ACRD16_04585 [Thermoanaerobaculia bacterium]